MLLLDSSFEVGNLTLFRDHISPRTFHYLPRPPRVVSDEQKTRLELLRFRGDSMGGLLNLDIELAHEDEVLQSARQELSNRIGAAAELVPVLFDDGAVRLVVLGVEQPSQASGSLPVSPATPTSAAAAPAPEVGSVLVERVLGVARPSLLGHQRAIFSVELTPEAATLLEAAIRGEQVPILIAYDLAFSGLRLARGVRARVDYAMAYNYLRTRLTGSSLWFKADLDREAETLERDGHIRIEDVDYQGSDPAILARRREEIRSTLHELMEALFFRPAASPAGLGANTLVSQLALANAWARQGGAQATFVLRGLEQHEEQVLTYDQTEARVSTQRVAPQGAIRVPSQADPARLIVDVTTSWPPPLTHVRVLVVPDADWSGVAAIQVDLRQGQEVRTLVLTPQSGEQSAEFTSDGVEYRIRALVNMEPEALAEESKTEPEAPFEPLRTANLFLDPAVLSRRWLAHVRLGAVDLAAIQSVAGEVRLGTQQRRFLLDTHQVEFAIPVWGNALVEMRAELVTAEREVITVERTLEPSRPVALINQPADRFQVVEVMLQDPLQRYAAVMVELETAAGERRTGLQLDPANPTARWSAARGASSPRSFRYRVRKIGRDAGVVEEDWQAAAGSLLVVGDVDVRIETIEGFLLGATESQGGLIRLSALEPPEAAGAVEIFLEPGQIHFRARLAFRSTAARRYTVSGQLFFDRGQVDLPPRQETSKVLLLNVLAA
jgi:hypothetical protein